MATGVKMATGENIDWCKASRAIVFGLALLCAGPAQAQRKFSRSRPPIFKENQYQGVFFDDVASMLRGDLPDSQAATSSIASVNPSGQAASKPADSSDPMAWPKLISPSSLEDLIKGAKLRLDQVVTTPPAFIGGGYAAARKEFSLLAILFAIIEEYPDEIRWKASAPAARELLSQAAASAKIGTLPVFNQAKNRLLDLGDLTRGTQLAHEAKSELVWEELADRSLLMQLLEWSHEENLSGLVVNEDTFSKNTDAVKRYAELVAALGKVNLIEDMPDADDDDYRELGLAMIRAASDITIAVETNNADAARKAAGQIGRVVPIATMATASPAVLDLVLDPEATGSLTTSTTLLCVLANYINDQEKSSVGIRFACHSCQHALHVKDFQAGRRGKCPECKTVFQIPGADAPNSIPVEAGTAVASTAAPSPVRTTTDPNQIDSSLSIASEPTQPAAVSQPDAVSQLDVPAAATEGPAPTPVASAWYLRLADGQQFGPVDETTFMQWLAEGRVVQNSHVWRDGWPEWQAATAVFPAQFPAQFSAASPTAPSPPQPAATPPAPAAPPAPIAPPSAAPSTQYGPSVSSDSTTIAANRDSVGGLSPIQRARLDKRLKKKRNYQLMLVGLCVAAVVLICVLVAVVMMQGE